MTSAVKGLFLLLSVAVLGIAPASPGSAQGAPSQATQAKVTALVRLPFPQDDGSLTPYTFELGYPLLTLVYDTLLWRDTQGVPRPWLAESVEPSSDGRQLTVRLVPGARWHDGAPVTATDVAFTFAYVASHPHPRFTPEVAAVERVNVVDASTVVIALRHASPGFLDQPLADLPILPAHLWQKLPRSRLAPEGLPVGSGPYRLVEYVPGQRYRFEANSSYFRGPPAVQVLEVPVMGDADKTVEALERRQVDMIPVSLPGDTAERSKGPLIQVKQGPSYLGTILMFNLRRPPFDRIEVRQAVAKALDLRRIEQLVDKGRSAATIADHGYLHPASPWASKDVLHVFDERAARAALAGSSLGTVQIMAPDNDRARMETGRQVALALKRAGVPAEVKVVPRQELSKAVGEDGSPPSFQAAIWGAPPLASYDPDFLRRLFGSRPQDGSLNHSGYSSPAFDELARRVATAPGTAARRAVVGEVLRLLATEVPVVPLSFAGRAFAFRPSVYDGWQFVKGSGILDKRSFLAPEASPATPPSTTIPVAQGPVAGDSDEGAGGRPFGLVSLGLLGAAGVLVVVALRRK